MPEKHEHEHTHQPHDPHKRPGEHEQPKPGQPGQDPSKSGEDPSEKEQA